jgi:hypothetical protein
MPVIHFLPKVIPGNGSAVASQMTQKKTMRKKPSQEGDSSDEDDDKYEDEHTKQ